MLKFNKIATARVTLAAIAAVTVASLTGSVAHAQGTITTPNPYTLNQAVGYGYQNGDILPNGASSVIPSAGNTIQQGAVATDYGQISNIFLNRYTPALVACGIAGTVILAGGAGVRMVQGWLRGAFH